MQLRLCSLLCCAVLCVGVPASAATTWNCMYKVPNDPSKAVSHGEIQIDGEWLNWKVEAAIPGAFPKFEFPTIAFRHRVLISNAVGIVAVSWQSKIDKYVGPVVSADVIVINKKDGAFRISDVGLNGSYNAVVGQCQRRSVKSRSE